MKGIILAAGPTRILDCGFPEDAGPKCLYSYGGKVLLGRLIELFLKYGISDIRVVVGFQKEKIEEFCRARGYKVEFVENKHWEKRHSQSIRLALKGVDDDFLITYGDIVPDEPHLKKVILSEKKVAICCRDRRRSKRNELYFMKVQKGVMPSWRKLLRYSQKEIGGFYGRSLSGILEMWIYKELDKEDWDG